MNLKGISQIKETKDSICFTVSEVIEMVKDKKRNVEKIDTLISINNVQSLKIKLADELLQKKDIVISNLEINTLAYETIIKDKNAQLKQRRKRTIMIGAGAGIGFATLLTLFAIK
jgi:CRISPR/Cas system CSM-associated protein Csm5 (group 7 of RAMP superfamily)